MVKRTVKFILDGKKRKMTYHKRKNNIMKKLSEITTLCDVEACGVFYSPYKEGPEIWPPSHEAVHGVLQSFRNMPLAMQTQNALTQTDLIQKQIRKVREQVREQEMKNREEEVREVVSHMLQHGPGMLSQMTFADYNDIVWVLAEMERQVDEHSHNKRVATGDSENVAGGNGNA